MYSFWYLDDCMPLAGDKMKEDRLSFLLRIGDMIKPASPFPRIASRRKSPFWVEMAICSPSPCISPWPLSDFLQFCMKDLRLVVIRALRDIFFVLWRDRRDTSTVSYLRRIVEFQWFFMALSVRPGSNFAIFAHWLPHCWCAW